MITCLALATLLALAGLDAPVEAPRNAGTDVPTPAVLHKVDPSYPPEALKQGVSGIVVLELIIDEQGQVASAELVRGVPLLDAAAIEAVRQWIFEVTRVDGRSVRVRHVLPVSFSRRLPEQPGEAAADSATADHAGAEPSVPPVDVVQPLSDVPPARVAARQPGVSSIPGVVLGEGGPDLAAGRRPVVPPLARLQRVGGSVEVRFSLDAAGTCTVEAVDGPELLKPQADQAVRSWKFVRTEAGRLNLVATFTYERLGASASVARRD